MNRLRFIPAALVLLASAAGATTTIGGATLVDTATVISGTTGPLSFLIYVSGGNGATGVADGTTYTNGGYTPAQAMAGGDHAWLQYDPAILMYSATPLNKVLVLPAIDHGWAADNTGEWWEAFEFRLLGCTAASTTACTEEGQITKVWTLGYNDSGPNKNADDFTTEWSFRQSYNYFAIFAGDRLVGGPFSPGEGEVDALAVAVPEPSTYMLMALGLAALAGVARRQRR